ncbi:MAG: prepilin-type N-terminal cleavage/methylation domain-containing protein [Candidatus Omnitrophota bacterium]|nr:prepilin-type N-terminal cleavage/methylation domain-containing protein [Candidatus Omnitrophota bacterium]
MKLPSTSIHDGRVSGFTLIEILVVLGLFVLLSALGLFLSMDVYRGNSLRSEKNMIISILQKARSRAMNNINQTKHGVYFQAGQYILFQGDAFNPDDDANNQEIKASNNISISFPPLPFGVVFSQLAATTTPQDITLDGQGFSFTIKINDKGRISWD